MFTLMIIQVAGPVYTDMSATLIIISVNRGYQSYRVKNILKQLKIA